MPAKSFEVAYLDPRRVHFERHGDTLSLTLDDGTHYPRVILRSCFPVSGQGSYLSIRDAGRSNDVSDHEQPEIGVIEDWNQLDAEERQVITAELSLYYFVPQIRRVLKIRDELGFLYWTVETDRGFKEFVMRNSVIRYAREVAPGHWLLIDVNQARYEIPDLGQLDRNSQNMVKRFLCI